MFKLFINLGTLLYCSLASYACISIFLKNTEIDFSSLAQEKNFFAKEFKNINYFNNNSKNLNNIDRVAKKYLTNNGLSLIWKDNSNNNKSKYDNANMHVSNAFLINIVKGDLKDSISQPTGAYVPEWANGNLDLQLIIGTTFSFAYKIFDKITNFKAQVNESTSLIKIDSTYSNNYNSWKLGLSQPAISFDNDQTPLPINFLEDKKTHGFDDPYYVELNNNKVELLYAAIDLENLQKNTDSTNKLGLDFAVLKIDIPINNLSSQFSMYLKTLYYHSTTFMHKAYNDNIYVDLKNKKNSFIWGGYEQLSSDDREKLKFSKFLFNLRIKNLKASDFYGKKPSEITNSNYSDYIEIKFFEQVENNQELLTSDYKIDETKFIYDDEKGILIMRYKISKVNAWYSQIFGGLKKTSTSDIFVAKENLNYDISTEHGRIKSTKIYEQAIQKPMPIVDWKEFSSPTAHYVPKSLKSIINERSKRSCTANVNNFVDCFTINNTNYINIADRISILYNKQNNFKGSLTLHKSLNEDDESKYKIFGIYEGYDERKNIFGETNYMSYIFPLVSQGKYDVFNVNNQLTKPSLGDALKTKKLFDKMLFVDMFE